ncbi:hypothetical protein BN940_08731 [Castellaniella defragrans 65Phen]|uniref:Uncharacterized protein n=1 Tax=Castellaniella defragrans (strain DSM 12143 / CCUG 39792 / 65Phen) TaxID=1437824 RepID=W8WXC6_CASD6|nr:hypothetical protein BN940_08731 [Castellaniella defragrans 65Phen]
MPDESERPAGREVEGCNGLEVPADHSQPGESERHAGREVDEAGHRTVP